MFQQLRAINTRPAPFEHTSAADFWTGEHTSSKLLELHLDESSDTASRNLDFVERSARWITSRFNLREGVCVADFGCGPGLYTNRLARSGADVTGIDFSARSIAYARKSTSDLGLDVEYVQADYLEYRPQKTFDLILLIGCDFCALSPSQRETLLGTFLSCLRPGGVVLLDVYSLHGFAEVEEAATYAPGLLDGFWSSAPYFGFHNTFKYDREKVVLDKVTIVEETSTRVIYYWLQYFHPEALGRELSEQGFTVVEYLGDVAGSAFDPGRIEFAIIVERPNRG